jgi:hypothetical protein
VEERLAPLDGQLSHILPPLEELLSLPMDDESYLSLEPAQRRKRTFEAIRCLLIAESHKRPLVVSVEDLHWMDRTSEDFISYFVESMPAASILLLLLYHPEYSPAWASKTYYRQILVDHLQERPSMELVQAILSDGEVSPELSAFITERAAGNPLLIEELTRSLLESGSITAEDGRYTLAAEPSEIKVPDSMQGIVASRLDHLPEEEKEVLQLASVIGREFSLRLLEEVTGLGKVLKSTLHALQSLELIYEKGLFPEPEYIFKHALTQEVAYESIPSREGRDCTRRSARQLSGSTRNAWRNSTRPWPTTTPGARTRKKPCTTSGSPETERHATTPTGRPYASTRRLYIYSIPNRRARRQNGPSWISSSPSWTPPSSWAFPRAAASSWQKRRGSPGNLVTMAALSPFTAGSPSTTP